MKYLHLKSCDGLINVYYFFEQEKKDISVSVWI